MSVIEEDITDCAEATCSAPRALAAEADAASCEQLCPEDGLHAEQTRDAEGGVGCAEYPGEPCAPPGATAGEDEVVDSGGEEKLDAINPSWIDTGDKSESTTGGDASAAGACSRADDDDAGDLEASDENRCSLEEAEDAGLGSEDAGKELLEAGSEASGEPAGAGGEEEEGDEEEAEETLFGVARRLVGEETAGGAAKVEETRAGVETPPLAGKDSIADEKDDDKDAQETASGVAADEGQEEKGEPKEEPVEEEHVEEEGAGNTAGRGTQEECRDQPGQQGGSAAPARLITTETFRMRAGELNVVLKRHKLTIRQLEEGLEGEVREGILKRLKDPKEKADAHYINLDLSDNDLGPEGTAVAMAFLRRLHDAGPLPICVRALRLFRNRIGDEGARSVVELIHTQSRPLTELHLSHNGITAFGAAMIVLAFSSTTAARYPFKLPGRQLVFGGCWLRLERNDVEAPESLLAAIQEYSTVRLVETAWQQKEWGPCRAPHWANNPDESPQVVLHVFSTQARSQKGGGKGQMWNAKATSHSHGIVQEASRAVEAIATAVGKDDGDIPRAPVLVESSRRGPKGKGREMSWQAKEPQKEPTEGGAGDTARGDESRSQAAVPAYLNDEYSNGRRPVYEDAVHRALELVSRCHDHRLESRVRRHVRCAPEPDREAERIGMMMARLEHQGYLKDNGRRQGGLGHRDSRSRAGMGEAAGRFLLQSLKGPSWQETDRDMYSGGKVIRVDELEASLGAGGREAASASGTGYHTNGHAAEGRRGAAHVNGFFPGLQHSSAHGGSHADMAPAADADQRDRKKGRNKIGTWQAADPASEDCPQASGLQELGPGANDAGLQAEGAAPAVIFQ